MLPRRAARHNRRCSSAPSEASRASNLLPSEVGGEVGGKVEQVGNEVDDSVGWQEDRTLLGSDMDQKGEGGIRGEGSISEARGHFD